MYICDSQLEGCTCTIGAKAVGSTSDSPPWLRLEGGALRVHSYRSTSRTRTQREIAAGTETPSGAAGEIFRHTTILSTIKSAKLEQTLPLSTASDSGPCPRYLGAEPTVIGKGRCGCVRWVVKRPWDRTINRLMKLLSSGLSQNAHHIHRIIVEIWRRGGGRV